MIPAYWLYNQVCYKRNCTTPRTILTRNWTQKLSFSASPWDRYKIWHVAPQYNHNQTLLQWHYNERNGVLNHRRIDCLLRCRSKKTTKLRVTGLCDGNSPVTDEFPSQRASYAENVSIWWHHDGVKFCYNLDASKNHNERNDVSNKQRVLMHGHQWWNVRHGLCHIYMIYVYIWVVYSFFCCCCLFIIVTTQFVALYKPCNPKPKPSTYDPPDNHPLAEIQRPILRPEPKQQICHQHTNTDHFGK